MPKTSKPVADYITESQFLRMLEDETDPMYRLIYRIMWRFMLRVSEVVGQSESDVKQILRYRKLHKSSKKNQKWTGPLPGIRLEDIDAVSAKDAGLECKHTLRVFRKMGKFEILPFNDDKLHCDLMAWALRGKKAGDKFSMQVPLFPVSRQEVLAHMNKHGKTVGGQTKIHPHALRRGGGVFLRETKGFALEDLQNVYSHTNLSQTLQYIGRDKKASLNRFARLST